MISTPTTIPSLTLSDEELTVLSAAIGRHAVLQAQLALIDKDVFEMRELIVQHWVDGPKFGARPDSRFISIAAVDIDVDDDWFEPPHRLKIDDLDSGESLSGAFELVPDISGARPISGALFGTFGCRKRTVSEIKIYSQNYPFRNDENTDLFLTVDKKIEVNFSDLSCISIEIHSYNFSRLYLRYDSERTWSSMDHHALRTRTTISSKIVNH